MGLEALVALAGEDEVHACCAAHHAHMTYMALQPWRLTQAQCMQLPFSESGTLLRDPPRASLGLAPQADEPDDPPNWMPASCTIEYGQPPAGTSCSERRVAKVDLACRLFVLNVAWSTTEGELWEHLGRVLSSGAMRSVVILRWADGRSRGVAKVVMRAPGDVVTAIERLNGKELSGRPLTLCHDRLQPRENTVALSSTDAFEDDGPMDLD